jgi:hypothetical protein
MQDLEAIVGQLGAMAKAFKEGGLFLVIGLIVILAFLGFKAFLAHRKPSQDVTVNLGAPASASPNSGIGGGSGSNGSGKPQCPLHSGVDAQIKAIEREAATTRKENTDQHNLLFDGLNTNTAAIAGLTEALKK